jgi:hypothetical protein
MIKLSDIQDTIINEVARYTASDPKSIQCSDDISRDVGVCGDDFSELAAYLGERYGVQHEIFVGARTIQEWSEAVYEALTARHS